MSKSFASKLPRKISPIVSVAITRDGKHVAVARLNHAVELWTVGGELLKWHRVHRKRIETVVVSDDGRSVASLSVRPRSKREYRKLVLWDVDSAQTETVPPALIRNPVIAPDSKMLVVDEGAPVFYDLSTGRHAKSQIDHDGQNSESSEAFAFSPKGELLASTMRSGKIRVWNMSSLQTVQILEGHRELVDLIAFSSDGKLLASVGLDSTLRIWNVATGEILRQIDVPCKEHFHFTYLAERNGWLLVDRQHGLRVYGIHVEDDCSALLSEGDTVNAVASGAQGSVLTIGREDGVIYVWRTVDLLRDDRTGGEVLNGTGVSDLEPIIQLIQPTKRNHLRIKNIESEPSLFQRWQLHMAEYPNDTINAFFVKKCPEASEDEIRRFHTFVEQAEKMRKLWDKVNEMDPLGSLLG